MDKLITVGDFHNRKSLKDMVYQIIRQRILDGQYQPGDQLSIDKLIKELKISRTPVKEAFNQLRTEGLIEIISQRGTYITKLSIKVDREYRTLDHQSDGFSLQRHYLPDDLF